VDHRPGDVKVRIIKPLGSSGMLPVIVYMDGGGWILGNAGTHDRLGAGAALLFVEYGDGGWRRRRGRAPEGTLAESEASVRMLELVRSHHAEQVELESDERERRRRGVTFRELATDWLAGVPRA
jgi:hypothetical protein